jgi:peptidoglycan hydrolase-like protein with peptidoglycan-binding domain
MKRSVVLSLVLGAALAVPAAPAPAQSLGDTISDVARSLLAQELDRNAFAEAQRVGTVAAYQDYLARFPAGQFKPEAQAALIRLGAGSPSPVMPQPDPVMPLPAPPALLESDIGLTAAQRREIQQQLTRLGFDTRGADGVWGPNTRAAIARWQEANRVAVTGYLTRLQVSQIARQAADAAPPRPPEPAAPEAAERALDLSPAERREIQLRLTLLGHTTQGTNGSFGPLTRRAIEAWQRSERLPVTGYMTEDQVRRLQRLTGG